MTSVVQIGETSRRPSFSPDAPAAPPRTEDLPAGPSAARARRARRIGAAAIAAALLAGAVYLGERYWTDWRFLVSTDDAYVQADVVAIAPEVSGDIASVLVTDNQPVKAGQVLAIIDQQPYRAAVAEAEAGVALARANIATAEAQIAQQQAVLAEAKAAVEADKAAATFAEQNDQRFGTLAKDGFGSEQDAQQAVSQTGSAKAIVARDQAAVTAAEKAVETFTADLAQAKASLASSGAVLKQAEINLGYTTISAPVDGVVGERTLRVGQYVQPGTQLLSIVPLAATYVVANFKETQLAAMRPGQPVALAVDTFAGRPVRGFVNSIAPASGEEFALLPPDNATGNFTKIVQRIPVKITIDPGDPLAGRLLPGMSVSATVDVRGSAADLRRAP